MFGEQRNEDQEAIEQMKDMKLNDEDIKRARNRIKEMYPLKYLSLKTLFPYLFIFQCFKKSKTHRHRRSVTRKDQDGPLRASKTQIKKKLE